MQCSAPENPKSDELNIGKSKINQGLYKQVPPYPMEEGRFHRVGEGETRPVLWMGSQVSLNRWGAAGGSPPIQSLGGDWSDMLYDRGIFPIIIKCVLSSEAKPYDHRTCFVRIGNSGRATRAHAHTHTTPLGNTSLTYNAPTV